MQPARFKFNDYDTHLVPATCSAFSAAFSDGKCKGTEIPLEACTSPEASMRLNLPDFKIIGT
jgi:hypothetical protein